MTLSISLPARGFAAALPLALLLAWPHAATAQTVTLELIGKGAVTDISADGRAATGQAEGNFETFRWTPATGIERLGRNTYGPLGGRYTGTPGISDDGNVIAATILDDTRDHATQGRWTVAGGWQQLGPVPADGGILDREDSAVFGMSRNGKLVTGLYWRPGQTGGSAHGSVWRAASGMLGLPTAGGSSRIDDGNANGSVLVGWEEDPVAGGRRAAVWQGGTRRFLDSTGASSEAASVNAAGTVIVGQSWDAAAERQTATIWRWNGSAWAQRQLGWLAGTSSTGYSYATALSDDGRIVVGFNRQRFNNFETSAFIWTEESGMVDVMDFLRSRGKDLSGQFTINFLPAMNGQGDVIAAVGKDVNSPFTQRSLLIKLSPDAAAPAR